MIVCRILMNLDPLTKVLYQDKANTAYYAIMILHSGAAK